MLAMARRISYLSICHFSHTLVIADRRPQVTLHVYLPLMVVFRDRETSYQHTEPKVTVARHDGGLPTQCLLSHVLTRGLSHSHRQGISLELCRTSRFRVNLGMLNQDEGGYIIYEIIHMHLSSS